MIELTGINKSGKDYLLPTNVMYFENIDIAKSYMDNIKKTWNAAQKNTTHGFYKKQEPEFNVVYMR
jgi:hypothetical protein